MAFESVEFDTEFAGPQAWAQMYRRCGLQVVPAHMPGEDPEWKRPIIKWREFEDTPVPDSQFERWYGGAGQYRNRSNMGAITGKASGGLVVIDLDQRDGKDGFGWWLSLLITHNNGMEPETPSQRTGGGGRQLLFRAPDGWTPPTFKTRIGVDIRGQGGFAMLPPSRHESGLEYQWEPGRELWAIPILPLPPWALAAVDTLREEYARNAGQGVVRPDVEQERDAWGHIVDGREARMANIIWGTACDLRRMFPGDPDPVTVEAERERAWKLYLYEVRTRLDDVSNEDGLEREGRGRTAFDERWKRAMAQWNDKLEREAAAPKPGAPPKPPALIEGFFDPWVRQSLPTFPLERVPPSQRAFVEYQTQSIGTDQAGVAMAMLTVMSGALDQRFALKMRRSGEWFAPPRLWTMLIGEPATKKTPVINAALRPLRRIEADYGAQYQRDLMMWEAKEKADRGAKPQLPTRFILNDVTVEIVGEILGRQQRGAIVVHDELSSFIGSLDRYGSGRGSGDRAFWLTAYNNAPLTVDRISRSVFLPSLCVAFLGGMQPHRISELSDLMTDGLLQRFSPILIEGGGIGGEVESELPAMRYSDQVSFLAHMKPQTFNMTDAALYVAEDFRLEAHELESAHGVLGRGFCAWMGKLPGVHGSLSLLLHILENKGDAPFLQVGEATVRNASAILTEFIIPHGRAFYQDAMQLNADEGLQSVGSFLLTDDRDSFTLSDLRYNSRPLRDVKNAWEMNAMLAPFVSGGWLNENNGKWEIAAGLRDHFAARRAYEIERKAEILGRFKAKGGES